MNDLEHIKELLRECTKQRDQAIAMMEEIRMDIAELRKELRDAGVITEVE